MFHADEGTDMTMLIAAFCYFMNAPKNDCGLDCSLDIIFVASFVKIGQMFRHLEWEVTGTDIRTEGIYLMFVGPCIIVITEE